MYKNTALPANRDKDIARQRVVEIGPMASIDITSFGAKSYAAVASRGRQVLSTNNICRSLQARRSAKHVS